MNGAKILIIDDERAIIESLEMYLTERGFRVDSAVTAVEGLRKSISFDPEVIMLDIRLPDMNGLDVLKKLRTLEKKNVIIITAFHDMDTTIKAVKGGAFEYITKPIDVEELERAVHRALKFSGHLRDSSLIRVDPAVAYEEGKIIGKTRVMKEIFKAIGALSENRVTILIEGETGTGKELIARAIHWNSSTRNEPLRIINCSAIVGTLLESELFGHEQGSFTGASHTKKGKFELAGEGTIFLDEVGEIPLELQSKLLRFLQEKEFERIGGERQIKSNARVIAATNRDLRKMISEGTFREDLYYRLSVATIRVPPLRERRSDIPLLIEYLLAKINGNLKKGIRKVEESAMKRLTEHFWPGNVRELENTLTQAVIHVRGEVLLEESLVTLPARKPPEDGRPENGQNGQSFQDLEKEYIIRILRENRWHLGRTCEALGISRPTLRQKMKAMGISENSDRTIS